MGPIESRDNRTAFDLPGGVARLRALLRRRGGVQRCYIRTFGCQQNVSDSERIAGILTACGYDMTAGPDDADLIVFNTCAVRGHAEDRVFGHVGELKKFKRARPGLIIAVGGCMVQQPHIAQKLRASYPYVDVIFNTNRLAALPDALAAHLETNGTVVAGTADEYAIEENLPIRRDQGFRAYIPVMYGCNNFCTYCVVPLVRGRERSRASAEILAELRRAVESGYKDVMLLGQNVNSYGRGLAEEIDFARLLRMCNDLPGDFTLRFMTSHPKDATPALFDAIADCEKVSRQIHLPVQSGSDRILREMNRRYTAGDYRRLIETARARIPGVSFTSDIIVGFPGETRADFEATAVLVREVGFRSLFTFIYSKREGTRAAAMPDEMPHETKAAWLNELVALQEEITERQENALVGKTFRALAVERLPDGRTEARLDDNTAVTVEGDCALREFCAVRVTGRARKRLFGVVQS